MSACAAVSVTGTNEKRTEIEKNGREISTRCHGESFLFMSLLFFIQRISSLCYQKDPDQAHGISTGAMLRSWRSWHGVLNTYHCLPGTFLFIPHVTGEQADTCTGCLSSGAAPRVPLEKQNRAVTLVCLHNTCIC